MKPFDIELAKAGHPVCTRDGRAVRILCFDFISPENNPIIGLVRLNEKQEGMICYKADGRNFDSGMAELDLVMVPEKREGWMNVYENNLGIVFGGVIHESEEKAKKHIKGNQDKFIKTIKVEWEE